MCYRTVHCITLRATKVSEGVQDPSDDISTLGEAARPHAFGHFYIAALQFSQSFNVVTKYLNLEIVGQLKSMACTLFH